MIAVAPGKDLRFSGNMLGIAAGANRVLTVHAVEIPFLTALRRRERGNTRLGAVHVVSRKALRPYKPVS